MNLLLLEDGELEIPLSDPRAVHIQKTLKLGRGDSLRAGVIDGPLLDCVIAHVDANAMRFSVAGTASPPRRAAIELLLGHPRPIVLRRMLRDLASLGIERIHVAATDLGEKSYLSSGIWSETRGLLIAGAAQGGFTQIPELVRHPCMASALSALDSPNSCRLMLHPKETDAATTEAAARWPALQSALAAVTEWPVALAVGSERGWTESELVQMGAAGFRPSHLGVPVLRTEVAAGVAVWSARARWEAHFGAADQHGW